MTSTPGPTPAHTLEPTLQPTLLTIRHSDRITAHRIAGLLAELIEPAPTAVSIFEDQDAWRVDAYYDEPPQDRAAVEVAVADAARTDDHVLTWGDVPDENWVAISQAALPPVEAGRFRVHGSHDRHRFARGRWVIEIDAGEAFGTAHHATTYGCLLALDRLAEEITPRSVLDLGTGSGVLAIAAARAWRRAMIVASDADDDAVRVSRENVAKNGSEAIATGHRRITVRKAFGVPGGEAGAADYDLVIANILAGPLITLSASIARAIVPGGHLVLSGILVPQSRAVAAAYARHGFVMARHQRIAGWSTLTMQKRPAG